MKKNIILIFILTFIFGSCGNKNPKEIELKLNLEKGKKYEMNMIIENVIDKNGNGQLSSTGFTMDVTMNCEVVDELANGNFLIRNTYKSYTMKIMGFDISSQMQQLIGEYFEMEYTPQNKLIKTTLSPTLAKLGMNSDSFNDINNIVYPDYKIRVGETWESIIEVNRKGVVALMKTKSKLISVKNGIAEVQEVGTIIPKDTSDKSYSGTLNANYKIELKTGLKREALIEVTSETQTDESQSPVKATVKVTLKIK